MNEVFVLIRCYEFLAKELNEKETAGCPLIKNSIAVSRPFKTEISVLSYAADAIEIAIRKTKDDFLKLIRVLKKTKNPLYWDSFYAENRYFFDFDFEKVESLEKLNEFLADFCTVLAEKLYGVEKYFSKKEMIKYSSFINEFFVIQRTDVYIRQYFILERVVGTSGLLDKLEEVYNDKN